MTGFHVASVHSIPDRLEEPMRRRRRGPDMRGWRRPRMVFVNSMSDLFHKDVPDEFIAQVFAVMHQSPRHIFQILTKRPGRMASLLNNPEHLERVQVAIDNLYDDPDDQFLTEGPLDNVWLGTSVENQRWADVRIPKLLETRPAVRFLSCEPLLGAMDLGRWLRRDADVLQAMGTGIDWIIAGGESGPSARPMHPDWARSLRDQAVAAGVLFFFKQWGEWAPTGVFVRDPDFAGGGYVPTPDGGHTAVGAFTERGAHLRLLPGGEYMVHVGKKAAGRELDGRTWDELPNVPDDIDEPDHVRPMHRHVFSYPRPHAHPRGDRRHRHHKDPPARRAEGA